MKTISTNAIRRKRRELLEQIGELEQKEFALQEQIYDLQKMCPHTRISPYHNYEDSGWSCPDCGGDWSRHPNVSKK